MTCRLFDGEDAAQPEEQATSSTPVSANLEEAATPVAVAATTPEVAPAPLGAPNAFTDVRLRQREEPPVSNALCTPGGRLYEFIGLKPDQMILAVQGARGGQDLGWYEDAAAAYHAAAQQGHAHDPLTNSLYGGPVRVISATCRSDWAGLKTWSCVPPKDYFHRMSLAITPSLIHI